MTFLWLLVWLLSSTPHLGKWNNWEIALVVCAGIDILGVMKRRARS